MTTPLSLPPSEPRPGDEARPAPSSAEAAPLSFVDAASALRTLRYGGVDEATTEFNLPPPVRATVSPIIAALRWGAVLFGLVSAAQRANDGDLAVVMTLAVVLFLTCWRSFRPLRLASSRPAQRPLALTDAALLGVACGWSGGLESPFAFALLAAAVVSAFGWGAVLGVATIAVGLGAVALGSLFVDSGVGIAGVGIAVLVAAGVAVALASFARGRLLDAERRRVTLAGRIDTLSETNDLLHILNQVARTLPTSLDMREALTTAREQINYAFDASTVCLIVRDDLNGDWVPQITEGCSLRPSSAVAELPPTMQEALEATAPILVEDLERSGRIGVNEHSGSGLYTALTARGKIVGLLAVEHSGSGRYSERDRRILEGLSDVLALTVDNARWFRRLRSLGAEEERSRIARDLHDRLGQWLTYISFELERIIGSTDEPEDQPELDGLYEDVQTAIDELRETLRQLRSEVTEQAPLATVAEELVARFADRTGIETSFTVNNPGRNLKVPVENELLRILQESLSNIDKHAKAESVKIEWTVADGAGELLITDDGVGFDPEHGIRENAYGLVGMRERADVVGAQLTIESRPDLGTTIRVSTRLGASKAVV